ncbi:hypothetical protein BJ165DRAFT_1568600 [Panaeolus papilionaceus]|nr:hypothetical protein BJ165DRAFT_1568600 [Panaeolus papilionaceus]
MDSNPAFIERYLQALDPQILSEYIQEKFSPELVALGCYTAENAPTWIDIQELVIFAAKQMQRTKLRASSGTPMPTTPARNATLSQTGEQSRLTFMPTPSRSTQASSQLSEVRRSNEAIELSDSDNSLDIGGPTKSTHSSPVKRKRDTRSTLSSDSEIEIVSKPKPQASKKTSRLKKKPRQHEIVTPVSDSDNNPEELADIRVTRQLKVSKLVTITTIPSTWTIMKGAAAYVLDLRDDGREWSDASGELLSMASIIKSQDQDAWGGGSAGHTQAAKCPAVLILDGQKCQLAEHECQGIYHCNDEEMRALFEAERDVNQEEGSSLKILAAAFYKEALKEPCKATLDNGNLCKGDPVYRKFKKQSHFGKLGFIGCSDWIRGMKGSHRELSTKLCARVLHPRNGAKGYQECAYTHIKGGKVVQGRLVHRKCPAKIKIYSPLDRKDRRAVVMFSGYHNHPRFPATRLSREGRDKYEAAIRANGASRTTVLKCDNAPITKEIFEGKALMEVDPALGIGRNRRQLVKKARVVNLPHGDEFGGVAHIKSQDDSKLPKEQRYIHEMLSTHDGVQIVITMLSSLAARIHDADSTLHDTTYKRCYGEWKEWEVVIWDKRLNMRLTVARIYSTRETRKAFEQMWAGFWSTVERVTGQPLKMKFIDGTGLRAILVDGCKVQVEGCGDALLKLIATRPHACIKETDPKIIVQHIFISRKLDSLAQSVSKEVMDRIRGFPFLKTQGECDEFVEFCQNSEYKCVRDWINDKKSCPWFIPSLNQYMSKIPEEDWLLTPGDTNLNESAHPFTNLHTGINLKLLDAVKNARVLDLDVAERIALAEKNCILPNHRNTKPERDHNNRKRQEARARKLTARQEATEEVLDIVGELSALTEAQKGIKERAKELHQRKKDIEVTEGIRRTPLKPSARGKLTIPTENDILLESDDLPIPRGSESGFGDSENQYDCDYLNNDTPPSPSPPRPPPVQRPQTALPYPRRSWAAVPVSYHTSLGLNNTNIDASTTSITAAPPQHHNIQPEVSEVSISDLTTLYGGRVPSLHELIMQFPHLSTLEIKRSNSGSDFVGTVKDYLLAYTVDVLLNIICRREKMSPVEVGNTPAGDTFLTKLSGEQKGIRKVILLSTTYS